MRDFRSTLLTLPDDAFFELIRNYLGPVKTPFNKHDLIARLMAFMKRDETQDRIISLIDQQDAELLTIIWLLDEPTGEELFAFLEPDHGFLDVHNHLVNLEDRLLIFRDEDRIGINPELLPRLTQGIIHPSRIFHSRDATDGDRTDPPWLTDALLVSFFSYLLEEPEIYRADGSLRKRSARAIAQRLPGLSVRVSAADEPELLRVDVLTEGLLGLGLIAEKGPHLRPLVHAWHRWARLPRPRRHAQLAGAAAATLEGERSDTVLAAEAVITVMPAAMAMDEASVARLAAAATGVPGTSVVRTIRAMERLGLLCRTGDDLLIGAPAPPAPTAQQPVLVQPNFELTLPAEIGFADALFVAEVCGLVRHDTYPRFELTKDRLATALRGGIPADHVADRLAELTQGRLPQNVAISIRTWEEEYESIRLHRGVVLQVSEERRFAVEHSAAMQELVSQVLAPGLYLLDEADVPAAQQALRDAGVEMVPELPPPEPAAASPALQPDGESATASRMKHVTNVLERFARRSLRALHKNEGLQARLTDALKSVRMPAEQQQELAARIQRKLILAPGQLSSGALKQERTEAKGLDYTGKVRIIEQSLSAGGYLEVIERTADGSPRRTLVEPAALRKQDRELILEGHELPSRSPVEFPVSKLALVRRLRATLFRRKPAD